MPSARIPRRLSRRGLLSLAAASAVTASGSALLTACGTGAASGGKVVPFYTTESDPKSLARLLPLRHQTVRARAHPASPSR
ncbi:hypothetical protein ACWV95_33575 [Streptomyces albus]